SSGLGLRTRLMLILGIFSLLSVRDNRNASRYARPSHVQFALRVRIARTADAKIFKRTLFNGTKKKGALKGAPFFVVFRHEQKPSLVCSSVPKHSRKVGQLEWGPWGVPKPAPPDICYDGDKHNRKILCNGCE